MSHNSLALLLIRTVWPERMNMTSVDDAGDLDRIKALAAAAGLPVEQYLQAALTAHTRRKQQRATGSSSLYQRIRYAGGLRRLVDKLYPRVLADPSLLFYFKQLDDERLKGLRWHRSEEHTSELQSHSDLVCRLLLEKKKKKKKKNKQHTKKTKQKNKQQ